ncbi:MAG: hypothetical protein KA116_10050 [Proteobacteria bacterium]|nr:hypothetical protein [Pseudomonadota bacterium]
MVRFFYVILLSVFLSNNLQAVTTDISGANSSGGQCSSVWCERFHDIVARSTQIVDLCAQNVSASLKLLAGTANWFKRIKVTGYVELKKVSLYEGRGLDRGVDDLTEMAWGQPDVANDYLQEEYAALNEEKRANVCSTMTQDLWAWVDQNYQSLTQHAQSQPNLSDTNMSDPFTSSSRAQDLSTINNDANYARKFYGDRYTGSRSIAMASNTVATNANDSRAATNSASTATTDQKPGFFRRLFGRGNSNTDNSYNASGNSLNFEQQYQNNVEAQQAQMLQAAPDAYHDENSANQGSSGGIFRSPSADNSIDIRHWFKR